MIFLIFISLPTVLLSSNVIIAPHSTFISAEINMSTIHDGLSNINQIISTLNKTKNVPNITYETVKLLDIMVNSADFQVKEAEAILERYEIIDKPGVRGRVKRKTLNPLHAVGKFADWAFGLTSQEHFEEVKNSFEKNLNSLRTDDKLLDEAVKENSKELEEYTELLKQFDNFLKNISANDDRLVKTDRLFLKLLKYKFNLDMLMDSILERLAMLSEILDQADLGLASRFMFSGGILKRKVSKMSGNFPGLQPVFGAKKVDEYFSLPLTLTHFTKETVRSLLRIPLVEQDAVFMISHHHSSRGLVTMQNSKYKILVKMSQYKRQCFRRVGGGERFCSLRPCLMSSPEKTVKCLAVNDTSFLVTTENSLLVTTTCPGESQHVTLITNLTTLHLPLACSLQSEQLNIRPTCSSKRASSGSSFVATVISDHEDLQYLTDPVQEGLHGVHVLYPSHLQPLLVSGVCAVAVAVLLTISLAVFLSTRIKRRQRSSKAGELKLTSSPPPPPPPYSPHYPHTEDSEPDTEHNNYSGVLELVCELSLEHQSCSYCAGGLSPQLLQMIEQNMKHSLNLPLQSKLTIKPYLDRKEWRGPTLLSFSTSLSLEEHMDMIDQKLMLIRKMTDSVTDKVYLHSPSEISNHSLSLYKINC